MASFGPVKRPISTNEKDNSSMESSSSSSAQKDHRYSFNFTCPFTIPTTPETAAIRIVKNLVSFGLLYLHFVYVVLFIALIPQRKVSLVYLVGMKEIGFLCLLFLRALPKSFLLFNKSVCKSFLLFLLCIAAAVEMILTEAGIHLLITLVSTIPVILVHATLWREDLKFVGDDHEAAGTAAAGEMVPILLADSV